MTGAQIVTSSVSYTAQGRILLFDAGLRAVAESRHGPATPTALAAAGERIWFGTSDGRVNAAWPEAAAYYRCFDGPVEQLFVIGDHLLARSLGQVAVYSTPETPPALASLPPVSAIAALDPGARVARHDAGASVGLQRRERGVLALGRRRDLRSGGARGEPQQRPCGGRGEGARARSARRAWRLVGAGGDRAQSRSDLGLPHRSLSAIAAAGV